MTTGKKDNKQETAIAALLSSSTIAEAAKAVKVSEQTLWRWMKDPEFDKQYRTVKKQAISHAITQLQATTGEAVQTLKEVMRNKDTPPHSKIAAIKTILEFAYKGFELEELEARIEELERLANEKEN